MSTLLTPIKQPSEGETAGEHMPLLTRSHFYMQPEPTPQPPGSMSGQLPKSDRPERPDPVRRPQCRWPGVRHPAPEPDPEKKERHQGPQLENQGEDGKHVIVSMCGHLGDYLGLLPNSRDSAAASPEAAPTLSLSSASPPVKQTSGRCYCGFHETPFFYLIRT